MHIIVEHRGLNLRHGHFIVGKRIVCVKYFEEVNTLSDIKNTPKCVSP